MHAYDERRTADRLDHVVFIISHRSNDGDIFFTFSLPLFSCCRQTTNSILRGSWRYYRMVREKIAGEVLHNFASVARLYFSGVLKTNTMPFQNVFLRFSISMS